MKFSKTLASSAVAILAVGGLASPASATTLSSPDIVLPSIGSAPEWGVSNDELLELTAIQTQQQIDEIARSGLPAVLLADDDGSIIAAAYADLPLIR